MRSVSTTGAPAPRRRSAMRRVQPCKSGAAASSATAPASVHGSSVHCTAAIASRLDANANASPITSATPATRRKFRQAQRPAALHPVVIACIRRSSAAC